MARRTRLFRGRKLWLVAVAVAAMLGGAISPSLQQAESAAAITGSDFSAGDIISDDLFFNGSAMSVPDIQSFLNSNIGTCTNGQCLNVLTVSVASRARIVSDSTGKVRCEAFTGGTLSAAEIIYRVQVACGISAKVILVTLQKEQGLVTKSAPSQAALDRAMGYACPDTAPCASTSLGFGNQVYQGALQLKTYSASKFGIQPGSRDVQFNPNSSCGSGVVSIANYATAALYNYTPYQPDAAALANVRGTGDDCSSYGNRNFWVYYNDWFGSTQGAPPVATTNSTIGEPAHYGFARDTSGSLSIYSADGKGNWTTSGVVGTGWNVMNALLATGDFGGSGHPDLISRDDSGILWMYPRDGHGGWLPRVNIGTGWQIFDTIIGVGDFSSDGHQDIMVRDGAGILWLYPGDGKGGFLARVQVGTGWQIFASIESVGDFNGDGHPDVLAIDGSGTAWLYPGTGHNSWLPRVQVATGWGSYVQVSGGGDFNGDGHADILARDAAGGMTLFPGNGTGGIGAAVQVGSGWSVITAFVGPGEVSGYVAPTIPVAAGGGPGTGDLSGDGFSDVLARDTTGDLYLYAGNGRSDWLLPRTRVGAGWNVFNSIFGVGDFNGDGHRDVMARDTSGVLWLYPGDGHGGWLPAVQIGTGWDAYTAIFAVGDFNGDGHPDIMERDSSGRLWLSAGTGTGTLSAPVQIGAGWNDMKIIIGAGNFAGNGNQDVLAEDSTGALWIYPGNGRGGWLQWKQIGSGWQIFDTIFPVSNFSGDGKAGVFARDRSGYLWEYPGSGKGTWLPRIQVGSGWGSFSWIG